MMGPGRPATECGNNELVLEFEWACRAGDYEFANEYKAELLLRLSGKEGTTVSTPFTQRIIEENGDAYAVAECMIPDELLNKVEVLAEAWAHARKAMLQVAWAMNGTKKEGECEWFK
ncbi:hypothetical protein ACFOQM_23460 [Paenibacillus sp. GCM10012307]|uniref:Uncharacterized protein n=1 Tax=Paenibacillus roseus TaxID=2798579 RepID=A0A934MXH1_9BACL|nr:hypothetical protein [Paenibacillus roseus]MBJ6364182.1 hypothetical protein [Paenibacillus roseus]